MFKEMLYNTSFGDSSFLVIYNLFVMTKEGHCLVTKTYTDVDVGAELLTGFTNAAFYFSRQLSDEPIQNILFISTKFTYLIEEDLIFAAFSDIDDFSVEEKLKSIKDEFMKEFGAIIREWRYKREFFKEFFEKIEKIIE